jgi:hypothetical protein
MIGRGIFVLVAGVGARGIEEKEKVDGKKKPILSGGEKPSYTILSCMKLPGCQT